LLVLMAEAWYFSVYSWCHNSCHHSVFCWMVRAFGIDCTIYLLLYWNL